MCAMEDREQLIIIPMNAPVKIFATGIRQRHEVRHSNRNLYVPRMAVRLAVIP